MRWRRLAAILAFGAFGAAPSLAADGGCAPVGRWIEPGKSRPAKSADIIEEAADRRIVLLGERHDQAEHQRWALHTIAALHSRQPEMALGFEAFPRRVQPVLDRWVAGQLDERAFLAEVEWYRIWGYDHEPYMAILHFARQNRVRVVALNVERATVARVGREGLAQVPPTPSRAWPRPTASTRRAQIRRGPTLSTHASCASSMRSCCGTAPWPRR